MAADDRGLVHGGFIFGMADYAAMVAVNDPLVVLGSAETKFLKPVQVGDTVEAVARVQSESGKKRIVAKRLCSPAHLPVLFLKNTCWIDWHDLCAFYRLLTRSGKCRNVLLVRSLGEFLDLRIINWLVARAEHARSPQTRGLRLAMGCSWDH